MRAWVIVLAVVALGAGAGCSGCEEAEGRGPSRLPGNRADAGDGRLDATASNDGSIVDGHVLDAGHLDATASNDGGLDGAILDGSIVDGSIVDGSIVDGSVLDAGHLDATASNDAGLLDATASNDASTLDAGHLDATASNDAGLLDATASNDAGTLDAGHLDATASNDAGTLDGGAHLDATASVDAAAFDAGPPSGTGDVWVEIDYSGAFSPQSPAWSFSQTPGWSAAQWAMQGDNWPEAWDRFNNMQVVNDPIGTVLEIGGSSELQLMIGLEELGSYQWASVRIEGRSRATSSWVTFDVFNPLNGCGPASSFTMAQDWVVHIVDADLGSCMVVGGGVQAVRVSPVSGTIALVRMRLTLHGATW